MRLNNYWWLLIWLFLFGAIYYLFIANRKTAPQGDEENTRWGWIPAILLTLPYIIWAAGRSNHYGDTGVYRGTFINMPVGLSNLAPYVASRPKGKGFVVFEYLFKTFISQSDISFFLFVALIQMTFLVLIFRKYSEDFWLSIFFFVASTDYLSWMHNGIRQFISVTLIFGCLPLLIKKKYLWMCLVVGIAALIHSAAVVFLPFIFVINGRAWNWRTILYIIVIIIAILLVDRISAFLVTAMQDTAYDGDIEIYLSDDGTNPVRVLFYAVPTILAWIFREHIYAADDPMINICVNLSVISTGVYVFSYFTSGVLVGAIPIYFSLANYILVPWLLKKVFDTRSAIVLKILFIGVYSIFFYYQCGPAWGLL